MSERPPRTGGFSLTSLRCVGACGLAPGCTWSVKKFTDGLPRRSGENSKEFNKNIKAVDWPPFMFVASYKLTGYKFIRYQPVTCYVTCNQLILSQTKSLYRNCEIKVWTNTFFWGKTTSAHDFCSRSLCTAGPTGTLLAIRTEVVVVASFNSFPWSSFLIPSGYLTLWQVLLAFPSCRISRWLYLAPSRVP